MPGDDNKPVPLELDASFLTPVSATSVSATSVSATSVSATSVSAEATSVSAEGPAPLVLDPSALSPVQTVQKDEKAPSVAVPQAVPAPVAVPQAVAPVAEVESAPAPVPATPVPATPIELEASPKPASAEPASAAPATDFQAPPGTEGGANIPGGKGLLQPLDLQTWIPEKFRKHVDGEQPPPVRLMAARAMVPMPPKDMVHVVFQAMFDPEKKIAALAKKTFKNFDAKILNVALGAKLAPQVLGYFCKTLLTDSASLEKVLLNRQTPDTGFVYAGEHAEDHQIIAMVAGNQERLLRCHDILRAIAKNTMALRSELDRAIDFLVREGVYLDDVDEFDDAFLRLGKGEMLEALKKIDIGADLLDDKQQAMAEELGVSAEELLLGNSEVVASIDDAAEGAAQAGGAPASGRRKPLSSYPVPVQIKLAMVGDHTAAMEAVHATNRVVANAGIRNSKIRDADVMKIVRSKSLADDVIRYICRNGDWTKNYSVKLALVQNPKTPLPLAMRWMGLLRAADIKSLAKSKQVPGAVQQQAKKIVMRKR